MNTHQAFVSHLAPVFARYLALKQALGRKYAVERDVLAHLDRFLAIQPPALSDLTAEAFALWCATLTHLMAGVRRLQSLNQKGLDLAIGKGDQLATRFEPRLDMMKAGES